MTGAIEPYRGEERPSVWTPPPVGDVPSAGDTVDVGGLMAAFRRRLGVFFITLAATLALVMAFMWLIPPQYTATARVSVEARALNASPDKETPVVAQLPTQNAANVQTEAQIIQSIRVADRVVDMLHLEKDPEFNGAVHSLKGEAVKFLLRLFAPVKATSKRDEVINNVLRNLKPAQYLTTNAIDIEYTDNNAKKAQAIANAFAQAYLDDQVAAKTRQAHMASAALLSQIDKMRQQADDDASKVEAYKIAHNLLSVGAITLTEQEISNYNESIAAAKAEAAGDQANLQTAEAQLAHGSDGDDVGQALSSPTVSHLREQRAEISAQLATIESHYGPKYPDLAPVRQKLADVDDEIRQEIHRTISNLAAKAAVSQKRLETMEATLSSTRRTLAANTAALAGLDNLTRQAAVSKQLYEAYLDRSKESLAQTGGLLPDSDIVSRATLPEYPSFPNTILFLALGLVSGVLFGCAAVLIAEMSESRLITVDDVERRLGAPYLGGIPLLGSVLKGRSLAPVNAIVREPASAYSEAFRSLHAAAGISGPDARVRVLLVTSALPQEGKTAVAIGLAQTSAMMGAPTVVVDCDFRRAGLTRAMRLAAIGPGLLEVLKGEATLAQALVPDQDSGMLVLPMNMAGEAGHALLTGEAMDSLLDAMRGQFRTIILDAPPALPIAAAQVLAAKADAAVLVARWRKTREAAGRSALRVLSGDRVRVAGVVLTRVNFRQMYKYGSVDSGRFFNDFKQYYA